MARKVAWSERALQHLEGIAAYISADSPARAALTISRILAKLEQASEFPLSGRVVPEYGDPGLRELFWHEYRIVYLVEEERVLVVGVAHGRRRLEEALGESSTQP